MLRVSKKERKWLNQKNATARRKIKRLRETFGLRDLFHVQKTSSFTSRAELNRYKQALTHFTNRNTHSYVKGGYRYFNSTAFFPIPRDTYKEIQQLLKERNKYSTNLQKALDKSKMKYAGRELSHQTALDNIRSGQPQANRIGLRGSSSSFYNLHFQPERIASQKQLDTFLYALRTYQTPEKMNERLEQAKANYMDALYNTFGNNAKPIIDFIDKMTTRQFIEFYESEASTSFDFIYDERFALTQLSNIANGLLAYTFEHMELALQERMNIRQIMKVRNLDTVDILKEYQSHVYTLTQGKKPPITIRFRTKELEEFLSTGKIPQSVKTRYKL